MKIRYEPGMMVQTYSPSIQEAEVAWSGVQGCPGLYCETLLLKNQGKRRLNKKFQLS